MLKDENGFTLLEMLLVLLVISILIILIIPNLTDKSAQVHDKGCDALVATVQSQVQAYQLDHGKLPTSINTLVEEKYIESHQQACQNGKNLHYSASTGKVSANK